jgi:4-diphosphocytidyl-2-C-methyl-D-erythritol kinase
MALRALYELAAPAKLNAFLHVVGRRSDGYHLLQSPFVLIDWCDTLHLELRGDGRLLRHDLSEPLPADDLCLRAARLLQATSGTAFGADISIVKRLPTGAGMGGGSSDAATTLLGLNLLWQLRWPRQRLLALALQLGADVPFFVGGHNAFVEGIGEQLTPIVWPTTTYAVVKPAASIATELIFGDPGLVRDTAPVILSGSQEGGHGPVKVAASWVDGLGRNDLEPPATRRCPQVAQAATWLRARHGNSRMTGSGSAVFARVGAGVRLEATRLLEDLPAGWVGRLCQSLQVHPLRDFAS